MSEIIFYELPLSDFEWAIRLYERFNLREVSLLNRQKKESEWMKSCQFFVRIAL